MSLAIAIIGSIIAIFGVIVLHEFGHFLVARACGIKVLRFSIGFGKPLYKWKGKDDTEYALAWLPLGGYVKMLGEGEEATSSEDAHRAFNQKPVLVRMLVVIAGPLMNFLIAIIAFWAVYLGGITHIRPIVEGVIPHSIADQAGLKSGDELVQIDGLITKNWQQALMLIIKRMGDTNKMILTIKPPNAGHLETRELDLSTWTLDKKNPDFLGSLGVLPYEPEIPAIISSVEKESPADKAHLKKGDQILAIDDLPVQNWSEVVNLVQKIPNKEIKLMILRENRPQTFALTVGQMKKDTNKVMGYLGVISALPEWPSNFVYKENYSLWQAGLASIEQTWRLLVFNAVLIFKIVVGKLSSHMLGGPITVFQEAGKASQAGFQPYLSFIAFISLTIGFINLLPIPGLDGGHLLFQSIEGIFRRPVPERIQIIGLTLGMVFIVFIMIQTTINDFIRLFF